MKTCFYPDIVIRVLLVLLTMLILTCDHIYTFAANAANSQPTDKSTQSPIIEYFKDHEVTERQARESLRRMTDVDFQRPSHCKCTDDDFRYCYSSELLKDHCCCNQSHQKGKYKRGNMKIDSRTHVFTTQYLNSLERTVKLEMLCIIIGIISISSFFSLFICF